MKLIINDKLEIGDVELTDFWNKINAVIYGDKPVKEFEGSSADSLEALKQYDVYCFGKIIETLAKDPKRIGFALVNKLQHFPIFIGDNPIVAEDMHSFNSLLSSCLEQDPKKRKPISEIVQSPFWSAVEGWPWKRLTSLKLSYNIDKPLGKGAFGKVMKVTRIGTSNEYAAKIMNISQIQKHKEDVITEVKILEKFKGKKGFINFEEAFFVDNDLYIIMELANTDLQDFLDNPSSQHLTKEEIKIIAQDIGCAIAQLHSEGGIAHRDIKPGNIMLLMEGGKVKEAKLADFGISKALASTFFTSYKGTEEFMAPEVIGA